MPRRIPEDRFHELIQAATEVFLEQGYRRSQMSDVAARLGVAKGTLYLYVESKEALLDAALRHADEPGRIALPSALPLPTPAPGETLQFVRKRIAEESVLPKLIQALERARVTDIEAELEGIVRELYGRLARHRVGIELIDRCAQDHPELAGLWFGTARAGALELIQRYLEDRIRRGRLRKVRDISITARILLETLVYWAVHRHWDPGPEIFDDEVAEDTVIEFTLGALLEE